MQVEPTGLCTVTALEAKMVSAARQRSEEALKATACWQTLGPAKTQVPFSYHVSAVASLTEPPGERRYVGGQAEGLPCTDDRVLKPGVNLIPEVIDGRR